MFSGCGVPRVDARSLRFRVMATHRRLYKGADLVAIRRHL
jgi:hypothetical protein